MKGYKMLTKNKREKILKEIRKEVIESGFLETVKDDIRQECSKSDNVLANNMPIAMDGIEVHITGLGENSVNGNVIIKLDVEVTRDACWALAKIGEDFREDFK